MKWFTESELQTMFMQSYRPIYDEYIGIGNDKIEIFKEFSMGDLRPDFVIVSNNKIITIIEFKITATIDSFIQLYKYKTALQKWLIETSFNHRTSDWKINCILAARFMDAPLLPVFRFCYSHEFSFFRINIRNDEVEFESFEDELPDPESKDLDALLKTIEDFNG